MDLLLLIKMGGMGAERVRNALDMTFQRRKTHPIPEDLPDPPAFWGRPFKALAESVGLSMDLDQAIALVREYYRSLNFIQK